MSIIDNDFQTLTIKDIHNKIIIRNIDEYNLLKYGELFKGDRIIVKLSDECQVIETYNNGIFNIKYKEYKMQIRDKIEVCKRLKFCMEQNTTIPIKELLLNEVKTTIEINWLKEVLKPFGDRVEIKEDKKIIIDNLFMVDERGQAYYKTNQDFKSVCIVADQKGKLNYKLGHELGKFNLNFRTLEIYSKVLFLLYPNMNDSVFINQLPKKIKEIIKGK